MNLTECDGDRRARHDSNKSEKLHIVRSTMISAPSRLHFGFFAVGERAGLQYGGIGLMIRQPRTRISISPCPVLAVDGAEETALREAAARWLRWHAATGQTDLAGTMKDLEQLPVRLSLLDVPPRHQGLGTGTQLAFATAMALSRGLGIPVPNAETLAFALDRGKRSAIGSFGFFLGGFLVDRGKAPGDRVAPLDFRMEFPQTWPVLIFLDQQAEKTGLSGKLERSAFAKLPPTSEVQREQMINLAQNQILSGLTQRDYPRFAEGLFEFGYRSGRFFESVQAGAYHSEQVSRLVDCIRQAGVPAAGQSSWGPAVWAILNSREAVASLIQHVESRFPGRYQTIVTEADNFGAVLEMPDSQGGAQDW